MKFNFPQNGKRKGKNVGFPIWLNQENLIQFLKKKKKKDLKKILFPFGKGLPAGLCCQDSSAGARPGANSANDPTDRKTTVHSCVLDCVYWH